MVVDKPITVTSSQFDHILSVAQPLAAGQREASTRLTWPPACRDRRSATAASAAPSGKPSRRTFIPPELPKAPSNWAGKWLELCVQLYV